MGVGSPPVYGLTATDPAPHASVPNGRPERPVTVKVGQNACPLAYSTHKRTYVGPVEQPRTRPAQTRQTRPRRTAPLPPQAQGGRDARATAPDTADGAVAVYRSGARPGRKVPPVLRALRRFPNPRLTGLGSGLFCLAAMLLSGFLARLLFDGSATVYGVLFLLVSALTAGWVRKADLVTAPVAVPISFAVGTLLIADGAGGTGALLMGVFTTLALNAGWLYAGTLLAGAIVGFRRVRLVARRAARRRAAGQQQAARSAAPAPRRRTA